MYDKLEKPVLPDHLYRYRNIESKQYLDRELAAIKNHHMWCAPFTQMNDPMEGFFNASTEIAGDVLRLICSLKSWIGIACLTDTNANEIMWAHYAKNRGICIEYDAQVLVEGLPDGASLVRLGYDDRPREIKDGDATQNAKIILSSKKGSWAYEREWRVLAVGAEGDFPRPITIPENCVKRIYLGSRIVEPDKEGIENELIDKGIEILDMKITGYQHTWRSSS